MVYEVLITEAALSDAEDYVVRIRNKSLEPLAAERWWNGLLEAIYSLESMPQRCAVIPEHNHFAEELRQLIYFSHRIIFSIGTGTVTILRIHHAAREKLR